MAITEIEQMWLKAAAHHTQISQNKLSYITGKNSQSLPQVLLAEQADFHQEEIVHDPR